MIFVFFQLVSAACINCQNFKTDILDFGRRDKYNDIHGIIDTFKHKSDLLDKNYKNNQVLTYIFQECNILFLLSAKYELFY